MQRASGSLQSTKNRDGGTYEVFIIEGSKGGKFGFIYGTFCTCSVYIIHALFLLI